MKDLLVVADELQTTLQVSPGEFAIARARQRGRALRTRMTRDLFGRAIYGLQKSISSWVGGKYVVRGYQPSLPDDIEQQLHDHLQPGDVIVTRKEHAYSNYFLPGYWPHVAFYIGTVNELQSIGLKEHENVNPRWARLECCDEQRPHRVLEALKDGVRIRSTAITLASDAIAIVRPTIPQSEIAQAISRGFFHDGKPYDFDFDFTRSDRMVCTEVVYRAYEGIGGIQFELSRRAGRLNLSAEDILQMALDKNSFQVVACYCPNQSSVIESSTAAEAIIRKSLQKK